MPQLPLFASLIVALGITMPNLFWYVVSGYKNGSMSFLQGDAAFFQQMIANFGSGNGWELGFHTGSPFNGQNLVIPIREQSHLLVHSYFTMPILPGLAYALLPYKLTPLFFSIAFCIGLSVFLIFKIGKLFNLNTEENSFLALLFLSSPMLTYEFFVKNQIDITVFPIFLALGYFTFKKNSIGAGLLGFYLILMKEDVAVACGLFFAVLYLLDRRLQFLILAAFGCCMPFIYHHIVIPFIWKHDIAYPIQPFYPFVDVALSVARERLVETVIFAMSKLITQIPLLLLFASCCLPIVVRQYRGLLKAVLPFAFAAGPPTIVYVFRGANPHRGHALFALIIVFCILSVAKAPQIRTFIVKYRLKLSIVLLASVVAHNAFRFYVSTWKWNKRSFSKADIIETLEQFDAKIPHESSLSMYACNNRYAFVFAHRRFFYPSRIIGELNFEYETDKVVPEKFRKPHYVVLDIDEDRDCVYPELRAKRGFLDSEYRLLDAQGSLKLYKLKG